MVTFELLVWLRRREKRWKRRGRDEDEDEAGEVDPRLERLAQKSRGRDEKSGERQTFVIWSWRSCDESRIPDLQGKGST
ncbi:hypothetical protein E4U21_003237 [Claviceps maximensis]|nr:hypothetical protein E4U21_003237 [Claviceps maximensis]